MKVGLYFSGGDMDRWNERFESAFSGNSWEGFLRALEKVKTNYAENDVDAVELARIRKVKIYFEQVVASVDPQLMPAVSLDLVVSKLDKCTELLLAYFENSSTPAMSLVNDLFDEVLALLLPYATFKAESKGKLRALAKEYANSISEELSQFRKEVEEQTEQAVVEVKKAKEASADLTTIIEVIRAAESEAVSGDGALILKIRDAASESKRKVEEVCQEYDRIFVSDLDSGLSVKEEIERAFQDFKSKAAESVRIAESVGSSVEKIQKFESSVFSDRGESLGFSKRLENFEIDQLSKFSALSSKIESLLPGAASAGLASAYRVARLSFDKPIKNASLLFYGAIGVLVFGSLVYVVEDVSWAGIKFTPVGDWESVLRGFINKLPFYAPAVWLAYYASKRRSEAQRLQQEYAHKEALAMSFDSYKKQVSELQVKNDELMALLLKSSIDAISYNASTTLDGSHGDKMPMQTALDAILERLPPKA